MAVARPSINTLRQAYTYGEEGIGERTAVAKSGETSYYLYDGRGSVTGVLSEKGTLTNSYRYDSYGNLTSGTPEAVNYYGYNGESANVKTGFQYLRARYYYAENGTFTTEDSDLGTKENPLTRNRYSYVMNNPLNYADPTGHRAMSPVAGGFKAVGKAIKTVSNAVKNITATVSRGVEIVANSARQIGNIVRGTGGGTGQPCSFAGRIDEIVKALHQIQVKLFCEANRPKVSAGDGTELNPIDPDAIYKVYDVNPDNKAGTFSINASISRNFLLGEYDGISVSADRNGNLEMQEAKVKTRQSNYDKTYYVGTPDFGMGISASYSEVVGGSGIFGIVGVNIIKVIDDKGRGTGIYGVEVSLGISAMPFETHVMKTYTNE